MRAQDGHKYHLHFAKDAAGQAALGAVLIAQTDQRRKGRGIWRYAYISSDR